MNRKDAPQTESYLRMGDQNLQRFHIPIQNWMPMPLHKMKIVQRKLPHNPFAAKGIVTFADMSEEK